MVPKGFVRVLGKLAAITDSGIPVHYFVGNHDLWIRDYFEKELNIKMYYEPKDFIYNNVSFLLVMVRAWAKRYFLQTDKESF